MSSFQGINVMEERHCGAKMLNNQDGEQENSAREGASDQE